MSLTNGVDHPTIHHTKQKLRFQGDNTPAVSPGVGGMTSTFGKLASLIGHHKPHENVEKFFLNTAKEGPMSIVPLESAVLVGRSERAYKRDGFLELQERFTEEIAAAVVWLYGVGFLQNQFEKVANKVHKGQNKHLSTNIAWNQPWAKTTHVDLNPQEMFAKNKAEINTLLGLKSARWAFSVGAALVSVGYLIPKANQIKTNLILNHLERRKRTSEGSNVQFGDPNQQGQANGQQSGRAPQSMQSVQPRMGHTSFASLPFINGNAMQNAPGQMTGSQPGATTQFQSPSQTFQANHLPGSIATNPFQSKSSQFLGQPNTNSAFHLGSKPANQQQVRFSGGLPGLSMVQGLGHMVEQTPYGSILVVDAGIAGGRGYVASKRSPYETAEVLFRDIGSLYFYILCAPHLMKLTSSMLDPVFKSSTHLQPKVADLIHQRIKDELESKALPGQTLEQIIYGNDHFMAPDGVLRQKMRQANPAAMKALLQKEALVYLGRQAYTDDIKAALHHHLNTNHIESGQVQHLLDAIQNGQGEFSKLGEANRKNLVIAVKQAFRHTVGISLPMNAAHPISEDGIFKDVFDNPKNLLTKAETDAFQKRITHMATLDGVNQTHSKLRRSLNVLREQLTTSKVGAELIETGDSLANWLDNAMHRGKTIDEFLPGQLQELGERLHQLKLPDEARQKLQQALGGGTLDSLDAWKNKLEGAKTTQLHKLENALQELSAERGTTSGMWPLKTQASKLKAAKESVAGLNQLLREGSHSDPTTALKESIQNLMTKLTEQVEKNSPEAELLRHYQQEIAKTIGKGEGKLFSLAIPHEDAALGQKLREMLRGGLVNDTKLLSQALDTVGQLETDSRKLAATSNEAKMRTGITEYCDTLVRRFKPGEGAGKGAAWMKSELESFYRLNRNLHYGARGISLATTMACIGWLVPIMQTKITKQLTGKDKNPGIANAVKQFTERKGQELHAYVEKMPNFSAQNMGLTHQPWGRPISNYTQPFNPASQPRQNSA